MAKLDKYKIQITDESTSNSVNVTSYPVEKGLSITDAVERQPKTFSLSGYIVAKKEKDAKTIAAAIENLQNKGKFVNYVGRMNAKNVVITKFDSTFDNETANGMKISVDMQQIRVAKTPYVKKKTKKKVSGKKSVKSKNVPMYHKVKKGDTYWGTGRKYGIPYKTLMKLNPWPARRIPIGVKMKLRAK